MEFINYFKNLFIKVKIIPSSEEKSLCGKSNSSQNQILVDIAKKLADFNLLGAVELIKEYQSTYGELPPDKTYVDLYYLQDFDDPCYEEKMVYEDAPLFIQDFYVKFLAGENMDIEAIHKQCMLQKDLYEAVRNNDVVQAHAILSAGADINFKYNHLSWHHTLWECYHSRFSENMKKYFWSRTDCKEINKHKKEQEFVASLSV